MISNKHNPNKNYNNIILIYQVIMHLSMLGRRDAVNIVQEIIQSFESAIHY
jgi:hypothetical protein